MTWMPQPVSCTSLEFVMRKNVRYSLILIAFFIFIFISVNCYALFSELNAKNYLQNLSILGLQKVEIFAYGKEMEIYDEDSQKAIIDNFSKIELTLGSPQKLQAPGGVSMWITLFYQDGTTVEITLPVFKHSTMWGTQYFFCKIDGEPDEGNVLFAFPDPTEQSNENYTVAISGTVKY